MGRRHRRYESKVTLDGWMIHCDRRTEQAKSRLVFGTGSLMSLFFAIAAFSSLAFPNPTLFELFITLAAMLLVAGFLGLVAVDETRTGVAAMDLADKIRDGRIRSPRAAMKAWRRAGL